MKLVWIEWVDSQGVTATWECLKDIEPLKPCKCTSVGFLLEDTKEYKTIVQSISGDQVLGRISIPIGCIKKVKAL